MVNSLRYILISVVLMGMCTVASATTTIHSTPLTFQAWKDKQILEKQNEVLRISTQLTQVKAGRAQGDLGKLHRELRRAQESLEATQASQIEEYVNVYLMQLRDRPEALQHLSEKLSREEMAEILAILLNRQSRDAARRNSPIVSQLPLSPQISAQ